MLEKPEIQDYKIIECVQRDFGISLYQISFLPLGADLNTAVYRVIATDQQHYFLKVRKGDFDEIAVTLPKFLSDHNVRQIIAPLVTRNGFLWADVDHYRLILHPFVEGCDGYQADLSDQHWIEFGATIKKIHTSVVPTAIMKRIPQEHYSPHGRDTVKWFLKRVETEIFDDPFPAKLAAFIRVKSAQITDLVWRAEQLADQLHRHSPDYIVCHSDLHAGNILISTEGLLYIVDWDNPILAPKERDLMFAGGAQGFSGHSAAEEIDLFYQGYGETQIDPAALAYYRYERIVQDIAVYCEQLFLSNAGGEDRDQSLEYLASNFLPNHTIDIAYRSDYTQLFDSSTLGGPHDPA
jgi:spectinomycin phosphotransferase